MIVSCIEQLHHTPIIIIAIVYRVDRAQLQTISADTVMLATWNTATSARQSSCLYTEF